MLHHYIHLSVYMSRISRNLIKVYQFNPPWHAKIKVLKGCST